MKKKNIYMILVSLLLISTFITGCGFIKYKTQVKKIKIENVDLNKVKDGTYKGEYDLKLVKAVVEVTVKDHKITDLKLVEHNHARGENAEVIPGIVLKEQTLMVDTVSGATNSSKIILKAIENALKQGI